MPGRSANLVTTEAAEQLPKTIERSSEQEFSLPPISSTPPEYRARSARSFEDRRRGNRGDIAGSGRDRRALGAVDRMARQDES